MMRCLPKKGFFAGKTWMGVYAAGLLVLGFLQLRFDGSRTSYRRESGYAVIDPEECGSENQKHERVFEWVRSHGGWVHPNLSIGTFPLPNGEAVRGMMAMGDLEEAEDIARVPAHLLLNLELVRRDPLFGSIYNSTPELHDGMGTGHRH